MKRRELLVASGALLAAPFALAQQPGRKYRIGVLLPMPDEVGKRYLAVIGERLATQGFVTGRNLHIDAQFVPYGSRPNIDAVRELLALKPDAMLASSTLVAQAAKAASGSVPVVFTWVSDPVISGIVKDYAKPGGNVTGVSIRFFELAAKRLELVRELLPSAKRVAVASGVFDSVLEAAMVFVQRASEQLGLELVRVEGPHAQAIRASTKAGAHAVLLMAPFAVLGQLSAAAEVARHAIEQRVPAIFPDVESVEIGGLMSYATDLRDDLRRGADLLARVLRGEKPGNLAVDQASRFELAVNLTTARAMGLPIPQSLLVRADRVIE
jgi:putative ABC transport system substrate-binding protein